MTNSKMRMLRIREDNVEIVMIMLDRLNKDIQETEEILVHIYQSEVLDSTDMDEISELEDHIFQVQSAKRKIIRMI